jgi:hypothetical protein
MYYARGEGLLHWQRIFDVLENKQIRKDSSRGGE